MSAVKQLINKGGGVVEAIQKGMQGDLQGAIQEGADSTFAKNAENLAKQSNPFVEMAIDKLKNSKTLQKGAEMVINEGKNALTPNSDNVTNSTGDTNVTESTSSTATTNAADATNSTGDTNLTGPTSSTATTDAAISTNKETSGLIKSTMNSVQDFSRMTNVEKVNFTFKNIYYLLLLLIVILIILLVFSIFMLPLIILYKKYQEQHYINMNIDVPINLLLKYEISNYI